MTLGRGLESMAERANSGGNRNGPQVKHLRVTDDGEYARIRFLTDADDIVYGEFHAVPVTKNGKTYFNDVLCAGEGCKPCLDEIGRKTMFLAWVYVRQIFSKTAGEGRTPVKQGRLTLHRIDVNEAWVLQMSIMHRTGLEIRNDRFGTLTDREYEWIRTGARGTKRPQYSLEPVGDPQPLPEELKRIAAELPDLMEVAKARIGQTSSSTTSSQRRSNVDALDDEVAF